MVLSTRVMCLLAQREIVLQVFNISVIFNLRDSFTCALHDFTCMFLSVTVQNVESVVQEVKAKRNPVNLTAFSY